MSTAQLSPGTVVDGRFTIGAPGWTRVGAQAYAANDERSQPVVLTAYSVECFPSGLVMERSLRELRQLQTLDSQRVASVIACGKLPSGGIYEVNAPLAGERLDDLVSRGAMPAPDAAALIEQVGEGLLEAQKVGVIHRNLGPRVIFVDPMGTVKVTGFAVGEPLGGQSRGPLDTIAPEQIEGKVVDQRTLIYNLAALMHMLLTGAPLHPGDPQTQLAKHLEGTVPDGVHARLKRALGRDPRMRPMMLKQFISELRAVGGGVARAPIAPSAGGPTAPPLPGAAPSTSKSPSSRGWTMFMKAEDGDAPAAGAGGPAAAPPSVSTPEPAKPKTRGWTMFMEAADETPEPPKKEEPAAKPKTRGWTMFMEAEEGGEAAAAEAAPAEAAPAEPAPAAEDPGAQPKTRGWTMFMEADEGGAAAAAEAASAEAAPAQPASPPAAEAPGAQPKTRGWTMFMEAEDGAADAVAAAAPVAAPSAQPAPAVTPTAPSPEPAAAPAAPSVASAPAAAPKSRGWTMFTEAEEGGAPSVEAPAAEAPAVGDAPAAAPAAEAGPPGGPKDADAPKKKRGWTVFMEKPIDDAKKDDGLGGVVPSTGESNAKGWTVFSPAAAAGEGEAAPAAEAPAAGETAPAAPAPDAAPLVASGSTMVATGAPEEPAAESRGPKTVIATHEPAPAPSPEAAVAAAAAAADGRPKTMVAPPGSGPIAVPPGSGPPSGPMAPVNPGAVSGPVSGPMSGPLPVPAEPQAIAPKKGSPVGLIVGIAVVVAIVVGVVIAVS